MAESSAAKVARKDVELLKVALLRAEHSRRCEGFYCCTCVVGKAEEALRRIEEVAS